MHQPTFATVEFEQKKRKTRREQFLERLDNLAPWADLEARIEPHYPKPKRGLSTPTQLDVLVPTTFRFSTCVWPGAYSDRDRYAFELVVHEAGHALGVSGADIRASATSLVDRGRDYIVSHPNIAPSVLNYDDEVAGAVGEPDCYPHPLDVMAIYALYQTGSTAGY